MLTPEQLAKKGDEHSHQVAFFQWIALCGRDEGYGGECIPQSIGRLMFAIPNGSKLQGIGTSKGQAEGARMKAEGLKAGVPDMMLPVPKFIYAGLFIELKKPGRERERDGGRSEQQVEWARALLSQHYSVVTAYGWRGAARALLTYLSIRQGVMGRRYNEHGSFERAE